MFRVVFWDILPCKLIVDRRFRGAYYLHHQGWLWLIPDDEGSTHLWNVGRQSFYTAVHPRRQFWTSNYSLFTDNQNVSQIKFTFNKISRWPAASLQTTRGVSETLSCSSEVKRLVVRKNFIEFCLRESFKSYKIQMYVLKNIQESYLLFPPYKYASYGSFPVFR
jgi:hypothetical protein